MSVETSANMPPGYREYLQGLFHFNRLTIRQKLLAIAQKYTINDEYEQPRFFVVRPPKLRMNFLAGVVSGLTWLTLLALSIFLLMRGHLLAAMAVFFLGGYVAAIIRILLIPYRDIRVYTDETESHCVMMISQDNKFGFHHWYTIHDALGMPVARAKRNFLLALFRRGWIAETLDGRPICLVQEDSLLLALLRRYLGPVWGLLRTNFDFKLPDGTRIGEYNRKLTLTDQYMLELGGDPWHLVDRRVALSLAILLDTAEGR